MAQAKITISREQAQKLGLLTVHTKTKSFMLYDPKSGITLRETKEGEKIIVPDGADITNLSRFQSLGYFTVVDGIISSAANARLASLVSDSGVFAPAFNADITEYVITLPKDASEVPTITATPEDTKATVAVIPAGDLPGDTVVVVTARDGATTRTYNIGFIKEV